MEIFLFSVPVYYLINLKDIVSQWNINKDYKLFHLCTVISPTPTPTPDTKSETQIQGGMLAKQVFYHWAESPTPTCLAKASFELVIFLRQPL